MDRKPTLWLLTVLPALMAFASILTDLDLPAMPAMAQALAAAAGTWVAIDAAHDRGGLAGLVLPLFLFAPANGFIVANSIAGALGQFPEFAGSVSALVGALQYGVSIVGSAGVGLLADGTPRPMGLVIAVSCAASLLAARLGARAASRHPSDGRQTAPTPAPRAS